MRLRSIMLITLLGLCLAAMPAERRSVKMLTVANGSIVIDGRNDDWASMGKAFTNARLVPDLSKSLMFFNPDQGEYAGPDDMSFEAWLANDKDNFYVLAHVRDQLLFNDAEANFWEGDDLELFIDANPVATRYAKARNENCIQFMFLPRHMSLSRATDAKAMWTDKPIPGLQMASRLRPCGYNMEIKIPKTSIPYWKLHPEMNSIGFDLSISDSDTPGIDSHHGPMKYIGYLLNPGNHFTTSEFLTEVAATPEINKMTPKKIPQSPPVNMKKVLKAIADAKADNAEEAAGMAIDIMDDPAAAQIANAALASPYRILRKAGLFILAKRPELATGADKMIAGLRTPATDGYLFDPELIIYSLAALAEQHKLPVSDDFNTRFGESFSVTVRLTYAWCLGINGDHAAVPFLAKQTTDKNMRVRIKAALALGALDDPAGLPALNTMTATDHRYAQDAAKAAIALINKNVK